MAWILVWLMMFARAVVDNLSDLRWLFLLRTMEDLTLASHTYQKLNRIINLSIRKHHKGVGFGMAKDVSQGGY